MTVIWKAANLAASTVVSKDVQSGFSKVAMSASWMGAYSVTGRAVHSVIQLVSWKDERTVVLMAASLGGVRGVSSGYETVVLMAGKLAK